METIRRLMTALLLIVSIGAFAQCPIHDTISYASTGTGQTQFTAHTSPLTQPGYFWRFVQGGATLVQTTNPATFTIAPSLPYTIYSTVIDSATGCFASDTLVVGSAGPDQTICQHVNAYMAASGTGTWTALPSNPAAAIIGTPSSPTTTILGFTVSGVYGFSWGTLLGDTVYVTVLPAPPVPLISQVGTCLGHDTLIVSGALGADSLRWTIGYNHVLQTTAVTDSVYIPTATNYYNVQSIASDGCLSFAPDSVVVALCVDAGPDQTICINSDAHMAALGIGTWSIAANPAPTVIASLSSPATTITGFTVSGVYAFFWTTTAGIDTVFISVKSNPTIAFTNSIGSNYADATATITDPNSVGGPNGSALGYWVNLLSTGPYTAHVNNSGVYTFIATDSLGCTATAYDTVNIALCHLTGFVTEYSTNSSIDTFQAEIFGTTGSVTYVWSVGGSTIAANSAIFAVAGAAACVQVTDGQGCIIDLCDTVSSAISATSVWPGDADANLLVDNTDLLPVGLGYDSTGQARGVQSIVWQGDIAADWSNFFTGSLSVNFKYADCNGDGIIDANDTTAILQNFGLIHAKTDGYTWNWRSGTPGITIQYSQDTVAAGDTLTATLVAGDSTMDVSNLYGLAFTYHFDPLVMDTGSISFAFGSSWLGTSANSISIHKDFRTAGMIKAAITGIDHASRSGYGPIASMVCIITTDNINGKNLSYYNNQSYISDITAIDANGNPVQLNAGIDSNQVAFSPSGIREAASAHISIYPNPASGQVIVTAETNINRIDITDVLGHEVLAPGTAHKQSQTINISSLDAGIYIIHVSTQSGSGTAKLVIR